MPPAYPGAAPGLPAARPGTIPLRPLSIGELFDGSFKSLRFNPKVMMGLSALVLVAVNIVVALLQLPLYSAFGPLYDLILSPDFMNGQLTNADIQAALPSDSQMLGMLAMTLLAAALQMLVMLVLQGILVVAVADGVIGKKPSPGQVWARVRPRAAALVGVSVLVSLIVAAPGVVWILVLIPLAIAAPAFGAFFGIVGGLGALVATIWLTVRLLFTTQTLVLEEQKVRAALRRSWRITARPFWRIVGVMALALIVVGVVYMVLSGGISTITLVIGAATSSFTLLAVSSTLLGLVISVLLIPLIAALTSLLYIDVRMRYEALDVQLAQAAAG